MIILYRIIYVTLSHTQLHKKYTIFCVHFKKLEVQYNDSYYVHSHYIAIKTLNSREHRLTIQIVTQDS